MRTKALNQILQQLASAGRWAVSEDTLQTLAGESANTFRTAAVRQVRDGILQRLAPGLYANPYASRPAWPLEALLTHLRPDDAFYVSLESALHEHGLISQVPSRLTVMTSGRSHTYAIEGVGVVEFVHTKRPPEVWRPRTTYVPRRGVHVASPELAKEDLRHVGRNLDLIVEEDE